MNDAFDTIEPQGIADALEPVGFIVCQYSDSGVAHSFLYPSVWFAGIEESFLPEDGIND